MGNLIRIPHSELHATLEVLEHLGVTPEDFARIRQGEIQAGAVARVMMTGRPVQQIRSELEIETSTRDFPVWRTVKLGARTTSAAFLTALTEQGCRVSDYARDILGKPAFTVNETETEVELCVATTAELTGKEQGGTTAEVFTGIRRIGGKLCPHAVGPELRMQYKDQPMGEWLLVAMEPISDSDGTPYVWYLVRREVGLWLYADRGSPESFWHGLNRWVFTRSK